MDLSREHKIIVNGKTTMRLPAVLDKDKDEFCLRSTREVIVQANQNKIKPCKISNGVNLTDEDAFKQYVNDLAKGIRRNECSGCWSREDQNQFSYRHEGNQLWLDPEHGNSHVEIILSNKCNAACLYCNSEKSSEWFDYIEKSEFDLPRIVLENKSSYFSVPQSVDDKETDAAYNISSEIGADYNKLACIGVYGGEPGLNIIEQNHLGNVLDRFYNENKMWDRTLRYIFNTNLNYSQEHCQKIINYFLEYKELYPKMTPAIQPSIESLYENFNFIRAGNSFENFEKNLDLFLKHDIFEIEFRTSLNNVALCNLKDFIEFANEKSKTKSCRINFYFIDDPEIFQIELLDNSFKKYVQDAKDYCKNNKIYLENNLLDLNNVLNLVDKKIDFNRINKDTYQKAIEFYQWIERERKLSLKKLNPELYDYFVNMSEN